MKKIMIVAFAALFTLAVTFSTQAQTPFFLDKVGAVAEYVVKNPKGKVTSYTRSTVTEIDAQDAGNLTVTYTGETFDKDHKSLTAPITMTTIIRDGVVEIAPNNTFGMEITGTVPSYPANLSVGQEFEYEYFIKMMGMKVTTTSKEKVTAHEEVTTPAGSFDCYKIEADMTVKMGITQNVKTVTWIAAGVGNVKIETYDSKGKLQTTQELISLK
jgi:hypothetical protein